MNRSRLQGFQPSVESTSPRGCFHLRARVASLGFSSCKGPVPCRTFPGPSDTRLAVRLVGLPNRLIVSFHATPKRGANTAFGFFLGFPPRRSGGHDATCCLISGFGLGTSGHFHQITTGTREAPCRRYRPCGGLPRVVHAEAGSSRSGLLVSETRTSRASERSPSLRRDFAAPGALPTSR